MNVELEIKTYLWEIPPEAHKAVKGYLILTRARRSARAIENNLVEDAIIDALDVCWNAMKSEEVKAVQGIGVIADRAWRAGSKYDVWLKAMEWAQ